MEFQDVPVTTLVELVQKQDPVMDLHCKTSESVSYIVEIQYSRIQCFEQQAQLYSAVCLSKQWENTSKTQIAHATSSYSKYKMLLPIRVLAFVNFFDTSLWGGCRISTPSSFPGEALEQANNVRLIFRFVLKALNESPLCS